MRRIKFLLYFLAALLAIFIIKGVFFGVFLFVALLKYMAIAGLFAGFFYLITKNSKKDSE